MFFPNAFPMASQKLTDWNELRVKYIERNNQSFVIRMKCMLCAWMNASMHLVQSPACVR